MKSTWDPALCHLSIWCVCRWTVLPTHSCVSNWQCAVSVSSLVTRWWWDAWTAMIDANDTTDVQNASDITTAAEQRTITILDCSSCVANAFLFVRLTLNHHFATVRRKITWFTSKCSAKTTVYQSMQNLCQMFKYSLKNSRNWIHVLIITFKICPSLMLPVNSEHFDENHVTLLRLQNDGALKSVRFFLNHPV